MKTVKINPKELKKITANKPLLISLVIIIILTLASTYLFFQYRKVITRPQASQDAEKLIKEIGKIVLLPNEVPTVATVTDKAKLQDQPFYKNAENGDKVLIFKNAKKAILYRPSIGKIVEIAPINVPPDQVESSKVTPAVSVASISSTPSTTPTPTPTPTQKLVSVAIYNGTKTAGLAALTESKLKKELPNITVVSKGNSVNDYSKTTLVDLSGNQKILLESIQKSIGGEITTFPTDETKPNADILIILGSDYPTN